MVLTNLKKAYKRLILERGMMQNDVARKLGWTSSNLYNRINKEQGMQRVMDIERIAGAMGYDVKVVFVDRETGKQIEVE